jgi:alanyl-tRNA synthetase
VDDSLASTMPELRTTAEWLRDALGHPHALVLAGGAADGLHYLAFVSPELVDRGVRAGDLIEQLARTVGGGGGGAREAFDGGGDRARLPAVLGDVGRALHHPPEPTSGAAGLGVATP